MNERGLDCLPDWRKAVLSACHQPLRCFEVAHVCFRELKLWFLARLLVNAKDTAQNPLL